MTHPGPIPRLIARALVLALIAAAVPLPAFAAGPGPAAPPKPGIRAAVQTTEIPPLAPAPKPAMRAQSGTQTDLESPSFFRTRVGLVVLGVVAAGTAYALYSTRHDRVSSPAR